MPPSEPKPELVAKSLYRQAYADLDILRAQLPEAAVVSLAREVLVRLANRSEEPSLPAGSVDVLSKALVGPDPDEAAHIIEENHAAGLDVETLYLNLLAPAAARLGEWWNKDEINFTDVAVGTGRVFGIMRNLMHHIPRPELPDGKTALFASVPGDTHTLGVKMAADLCRQRGWQIDLALAMDHDTLMEHILDSGHLLIGLSAGGLHSLPDLTRIVLALRVSQPSARVLIAGQIVDKAPRSLQLLHVDAMSSDFETALARLQDTWDQLRSYKSESWSG